MRLFKRLGLIALLLLAALFGGAWWSVGQLLNKEALAARLEDATSAKVSIGSVEASLLSFPASVKVAQLRLTPRDPAAVKTSISIEQATLKLSLVDLLFGKTRVDQLLISGVDVRDEIGKDGSSPLLEMLGKKKNPEPLLAATTPDSAPPPAQPEPAAEVTAPPAQETATVPGAAVSEERTASKGPSLFIREAVLEKVNVHIVDRQRIKKNDLDDFSLRIYDTDIDPADLAHHNTGKISLAGRLKVQGRMKVNGENQDVQELDLGFKADGTVQPFDAATGELSPQASLTATLLKDSQIAGHIKVGDMGGDDGLDKVKDLLGIELKDIPLGGILQRDLVAKLALAGSRVEWLEEGTLEFPDYTFEMKAGSWLDDEEHHQQILVQPSRAFSDRIVEGVRSKRGDEAAKALLTIFPGAEGQVAFDIVIRGPRKKPSIGVPPETLKRAFAALGGGLLNGLLK